MAFLTVGKTPDKDRRLYIMEFDILDTKVFKIGVSSGVSSKRRLLEVVGSYFDVFRCTPVVRIVRDRKVDKAFELEAILHRYFKKYQYLPTSKFDGSTELFEVCKDDVIQAYEAVVEGYPEPAEPYIKKEDILPF